MAETTSSAVRCGSCRHAWIPSPGSVRCPRCGRARAAAGDLHLVVRPIPGGRDPAGLREQARDLVREIYRVVPNVLTTGRPLTTRVLRLRMDSVRAEIERIADLPLRASLRDETQRAHLRLLTAETHLAAGTRRRKSDALIWRTRTFPPSF